MTVQPTNAWAIMNNQLAQMTLAQQQSQQLGYAGAAISTAGIEQPIWWGIPNMIQSPARDFTAEAVEIIRGIAKAFGDDWQVRNSGPNIVIEHKAMGAGIQTHYPGNNEYVTYVTTQLLNVTAAHQKKQEQELHDKKVVEMQAWLNEAFDKAEKRRWKDNPPHRILAPRAPGRV